MSLNDEERRSMVMLEMEKAHRFMNQADLMHIIENKDRYIFSI